MDVPNDSLVGTAGLSKRFVENLVSVLEFLLLFYGRNDLPFQSINKIGFISTDLKNDIAIYEAACEVEKFNVVQVPYEEVHSIEDVDSIDGAGSTCWRICCNDDFRKAIPAGYLKVRVSIKIEETQYLFAWLMKFVKVLFGDKEFYAYEVYTSECGTTNLYIVFLIPPAKDKDPEKAFEKAFKNVTQSFNFKGNGIRRVVLISHNREPKTLYRKYIITIMK